MDVREGWIERYRQVRGATEALAAPLTAEDQQLQSMATCSPTRWHRAHTTWFFETFLLLPRGVEPLDPHFGYLFNSYYEAVGPRHARPARGAISRPGAAEIATYRRRVDERVIHLLATTDDVDGVAAVLRLGLAHEEQHQELLLTDILHAFSRSPLAPAYRDPPRPPRVPAVAPVPLAFVGFDGGLVDIGAPADPTVFSFDNEHPRHRVWLRPFALASRLLTLGEVRAFVDAGGYRTPSLWLSDGFDFVRANDLRAPLYTTFEPGSARVYGLDGLRDADEAEPAAHLSFYEADAIARFFGARLPTEQEWELAAGTRAAGGNLLESRALRPLPATDRGLSQLFGDVWEWTGSAYAPYPGYNAPPGALGEYNGKFMVNQVVLRGGSAFTPAAHARATCRNFWHPDTRFQLTGLRLARDA
jgi:ergothioneine biosynthesis protein EgtB